MAKTDRRAASSSIPVPRPRGMPFLGALPRLATDPFGYCMSAAAAGDGVVRLGAGPVSAYLVSDPDYIRHILVSGAGNYIKGSMMDGIRLALGNGLFTADGEHWKRQRRLLQPTFHHRQIARIASYVGARTDELIDRLDAGADSGVPTDIMPEIMRLNVEVVLGTLFGASVTADQSTELLALTERVFHGMTERVWAFFLPPWLPTPGGRAYQRAIDELDAVVYDMIARRRARGPINENNTGDDTEDLLDLLLAAEDADDGGRMDDRQIRDEIFTIFVAGYESTASAITWCLSLLVENPHVVEKIRDELISVYASGGPDPTEPKSTVPKSIVPTFEDLAKLPYGRRVLDETLRLYPAFPMYFRTSVEPDQLGPYALPAGAKIVVSPYATGRDGRYWSDPGAFDPDRFSPDRFDSTQRRAYYPFGKGNRVCIGERMSLVTAQLVIARIVAAFDFSLAPGATVSGRYAMTYQPKDGLPLLLTRRTHSENPPVDG